MPSLVNSIYRNIINIVDCLFLREKLFKNIKSVHISIDDVSLCDNFFKSELWKYLRHLNLVFNVKFTLNIFFDVNSGITETVKKYLIDNKNFVSVSFHGNSDNSIPTLEAYKNFIKEFGDCMECISDKVRLHCYEGDSELLEYLISNEISERGWLIFAQNKDRACYGYEDINLSVPKKSGRVFVRSDALLEHSVIKQFSRKEVTDKDTLILFFHEQSFYKYKTLKYKINSILNKFSRDVEYIM